MEREFGVVGSDVPALGQRGNRLAGFRVVFGQPVEERHVDAASGCPLPSCGSSDSGSEPEM